MYKAVRRLKGLCTATVINPRCLYANFDSLFKNEEFFNKNSLSKHMNQFYIPVHLNLRLMIILSIISNFNPAHNAKVF